MKKFEPIGASQEIVQAVERYLRSSFNPRRQSVAREYGKALDESTASRDIGGSLFREIRRNFLPGKSLETLIGEGLAHPELGKFTKFPLHAHQSEAFELTIRKNRNVIVATGTGSGKTESFLLPIVDSLLKERDEGTLDDGIRAIVIYPMNALASDQLERLRDGLAPYPEITFGRFVGPTKKTRKEALARSEKPFPVNEKPSREEMIAKPPHILITNYAMLERLLLLPQWDSLFSKKMKWVVLDEVHSYDGTRAIEISMLLRRLKIRTGAREGVQCIAASATLGDPNSELDGERAAHYATTLFGEPFEPADLIRPKYIENQTFEDPVDIFLPENRNLIDQYRKDDFGAFHLFVRNPGGAFICLALNHDLADSRIHLQDRKFCLSCEKRNLLNRLVEIGACRQCGIEYLIAKKLGSDELVTVAEGDESAGFYRLLAANLPDWDEEDRIQVNNITENDEVDGAVQTSSSKWWCSTCGKIQKTATCDCGSSLIIQIDETLRPDLDGKLRCSRCGSPNQRNPFGPVMRPVSGVDALTSVITTSLYQNLPTDDSVLGAGNRKLLAFSDSRQNAAYFAPYLQDSYFDLLRRRVIYQAVKDLDNSKYSTSPFSLHEVAAAMKNYEMELAKFAKGPMWTWTWLRGELLTTDVNSTLSDTGLVHFFVPKKKMMKSLKYLMDLGLSEDVSWNLANALLKTVAYDGAVELPTGVHPDDEIFAPSEKPTYLVKVGAVTSSVRWISEAKGGNKRSSLVERAFGLERFHGDEILLKLWDLFFDDEILRHEKNGLRSIDNSAWVARSGQGEVFRCPKCRRNSIWLLPNNVCTTKGCDGKPIAFQVLDENHYKHLFSSLEIAPLVSKEHTAQWTADEAETVQDEFISGAVNVLSCSTTFEMGVDIGSIVAVLCRNVPPTPANYVQRAGRAGRRQGDKALIVTFARKRSHDSMYVADPLRLIKGRIPVPSISLENHDLIRRHLYTMALSRFLGEINFTSTDSEDFFGSENGSTTVSEQFRRWLHGQPALVAEDIKALELPLEVERKLRIPEWGWVSMLEEVDENGRGAWLLSIEGLYTSEMKAISELIAELLNQKGSSSQLTFRAGNLMKVKEDLKKKQMIELLANGGVLPKYGFPVDVASLVPSFASPQQANKVELQRDLSLAISEYAPGSRVVAGGHVLTSTGIRKPANHSFGSMRYVSYTCDRCGWFHHELAPDGSQGITGVKAVCDSCGQALGPNSKKLFIQPRFGFIASVDPKSAGMNSRPHGASGSISYVSSGRESDSDWVKNGNLSLSVAHDSQLLTVSSRESLFCNACGYARPGDQGRVTKHNDPRSERPCNSKAPLTRIYFGHEFKTDVLRLKFNCNFGSCDIGDLDCLGPLESAASALVSGATRVLGIASSDLNSSVRRLSTGENRLNIFDTTPGGVGLAVSLSQRIAEVLDEAKSILRNCPNCSELSSCYSCLRNYSNQRRHEHLIRARGLEVLSNLRLNA